MNHLAFTAWAVRPDGDPEAQWTMTRADALLLLAAMSETREVLSQATAFKTSHALNRARVLLGGPDMEKHDKRCVLYGGGRVVCHSKCRESVAA